MKFLQGNLLYFGLLTVGIEWLALGSVLVFIDGFSLTNPISILSRSEWPVSHLFSLVMTAIGLTYALFSFSLVKYTKAFPWTGVIGGIALTAAGWIPSSEVPGFQGTVHNLFSLIAGLCYIGMIGLGGIYFKGRLKNWSRAFSILAILAMILSAFSVFFSQSNEGYFELILLIVIQLWAITVVYSERSIDQLEKARQT